MPRVIAISGPIKPTGGLRQLPDIPLVPLGAPETVPTGRVWPVPVSMLRPMGAFDNAGDRICRLVKIIG